MRGVLNVQSVRYSSIHHWPFQSTLSFSAGFSQLCSSMNFSYYSLPWWQAVFRQRKDSQTTSVRYIHNFPFMFSINLSCFKDSRSSTFLRVNMKLSISPLSLIIRWSLNPKNHPIEHFPRSARPSMILWISIRWVRQIRKGVESTKLIPVQVLNKTFLMKMVKGSNTYFSNSTKRV